MAGLNKNPPRKVGEAIHSKILPPQDADQKYLPPLVAVLSLGRWFLYSTTGEEIIPGGGLPLWLVSHKPLGLLKRPWLHMGREERKLTEMKDSQSKTSWKWTEGYRNDTSKKRKIPRMNLFWKKIIWMFFVLNVYIYMGKMGEGAQKIQTFS